MESFKDKLLNGEINDEDFWVTFFDITHQTLNGDLIETIKDLQNELNEKTKKVQKMTTLFKKLIEITDCKCLEDCYEINRFCDRCNLNEDFLDLNVQHLDDK